MTREELVLSKIDINKGVGLEIGPLTSPIIKKGEAKIFYADHMNQTNLREKYKDAPLKIEEIVPVDFVVKDNLLKAVGNKKFDYIIACHVIEHIPDIIGWLNDISSILKPGGTLAMAIPDKRYTFDIVRDNSSPAEIIGAYWDHHTRATSAMMYDFVTEGRKNIHSREVWTNTNRNWSAKPRLYSKEEGYKICMRNLSGEYIDSHCHVFTPHSFTKILKELMENNLFGFEIIDFKETNDQNIEFYISLRKLPKNELSMQRMLASLPRLSKIETIESIRKQNDSLLTQISSLESEIAALHNSKSWKLTNPLRAMSHRLSNLKNK